MTESIHSFALQKACSMAYEAVVGTIVAGATAVYYLALSVIQVVCDGARGAALWMRLKVVRTLLPHAGEESDWSETQTDAAKRSNLRLQHVEYRTSDDVLLRGVEIRHPQSCKWIVYFTPFGKNARSCFKELRALAVGTPANILCYDYRGCGRSDGEPYSEEELIKDHVAIITRLKAMDITLYGCETGANTATRCLEELQKRGKRANLICQDCSTSLAQYCRDASMLGAMSAWMYSMLGWELTAAASIARLRTNTKVLAITHVSSPTFLQANELLRLAPAGKKHISLEDDMNFDEEYARIVDSIKKM